VIKDGLLVMESTKKWGVSSPVVGPSIS